MSPLASFRRWRDGLAEQERIEWFLAAMFSTGAVFGFVAALVVLEWHP